MSTYKQMPLPPLGRTATTITEADRAGIMAQAAAVIDYYLNGAGSYYDEGPEKDLDATLGDVHRFYGDIQSLQQSTTDQTGILKDLLKSVEETEGRIKTAIEKNDPRDSIQIPLDNAPGSNDIIIDELDENGRLPLGKYIPITLRTNDGRGGTDTIGWQAEANASPFGSAHQAVPFASYPNMPYSAAPLSGQTFNDQARVLRLVPPQQQSDFDSPAVLRSLVDQGVAASAAPAPSEDMNELLKLRAIVQAVGSRGLFPIR